MVVVLYQDVKVDHLPAILSYEQVQGFQFSPDIIWIFDLDRHGFWWGNDKSLAFWGLDNVQQLIDKDLSGDTEGARKRTEQTFVKAALEGQTEDPWTTYPNGEPKLMMMRHVAVLLGEEKHRGIIAFISEQIDTNRQPENLLFAEAVRYTSVAVSCYDLNGKRLFENPAYTEWYGNEVCPAGLADENDFTYRFAAKLEGRERFEQGTKQRAGHQEHLMHTKKGIRRHNLDIRSSRHPISGDFVILVTEYDVTELHDSIAELENTKEELKKLAHYDPLTKLPSVWLTRERLKGSLLRAKRDKSILAVMFIDLDGFKGVNDSYGHASGDQLLKIVAQRLIATFRASDTVGRIGGDEFLVCLPDLQQNQDAIHLAKKAIEEVAQDYQISDDAGTLHTVKVSASIGLAFYPDAAQDADTLIRLADKNMYQAKKRGKNQFAI